MKVGRDSVVAISYALFDAQGELLERTSAPVHYLHGGHDGIFPLIEQALQGKAVGETARVKLEPGDAFGDYDEMLLRVEPRELFPEALEVGMRFEGIPGDADAAAQGGAIFTVTDIAEGKVVLDANHPLAGMALVFECTVEAVRAATGEEVAHGHVHDEGTAPH
ncbi:MAG: peptidylprolyl isomerase [Burkholderiales bacterium]|nr:peptidylprolyl isomerase [Burkholderiales bacterium]